MNGRKIKHKLKDDATDTAEWCDGDTVGMSEDIVTIEYVGYSTEKEAKEVHPCITYKSIRSLLNISSALSHSKVSDGSPRLP